VSGPERPDFFVPILVGLVFVPILVGLVFVPILVPIVVNLEFESEINTQETCKAQVSGVAFCRPRGVRPLGVRP
jgi:hypothetical protein